MATVREVLDKASNLGYLAKKVDNAIGSISTLNDAFTEEEKSNRNNIRNTLNSIGLEVRDLERIKSFLYERELQLKNQVYEIKVDIK